METQLGLHLSVSGSPLLQKKVHLSFMAYSWSIIKMLAKSQYFNKMLIQFDSYHGC